MSNNYIKTLDPIQGLYDYVQDIKPYHTKIMEVLIEYVYDDDVKTVFDEQLQLSWGPTKFDITLGAGSPIGSPQSSSFDLVGDFLDAVLIGDEVTLVLDGVRTVHSVVSVDFVSGMTTVDVSPSFDGNPATFYVLLPGDVVPYFSFDVTEINAEENYILVSGPATATIFSGQEILMMGSSLNDGELVVTGSPTFNGLVTKIPVVGPLNEETVGSPLPLIEPVRYFVA